MSASELNLRRRLITMTFSRGRCVRTPTKIGVKETQTLMSYQRFTTFTGSIPIHNVDDHRPSATD